jgi:hypothetical protein
MFDDDEDGGKWIPSKPIMAKLFSTLHTKWRNHLKWMCIDYNTLPNAAFNGLKPDWLKRRTLWHNTK